MENPEKVRKDAGISTLDLEKKPSKKKEYECPICTETYNGANMYALGCGHKYCLDCWKSYLEVGSRIEESSGSNPIIPFFSVRILPLFLL
jgi:hypothetical protein